MMFWSIIASELVLAWAVRQWFAARVRESYNKVYGEYYLLTLRGIRVDVY